MDALYKSTFTLLYCTVCGKVRFHPYTTQCKGACTQSMQRKVQYRTHKKVERILILHCIRCIACMKPCVAGIAYVTLCALLCVCKGGNWA